ncbi:MAG: hypothetical protein ABSB78_01665 [Bacteroidota bacterium]
MTKQKTVSTLQINSTPQKDSLTYLLDILKMEIESINAIIARMDEITQTTKNWAIVTWAGSVALALTESSLRAYISLTAVLPLIFWYIDGHWRHLQGRSIYRMNKIHEFLNSESFQQSFVQNRLIDFKVLDPIGRQYLSDINYKKAVSIRRTQMYASVIVFYFALVFISIGLGLLFHYR